MKKYIISLVIIAVTAFGLSARQLKVLAIGNSFSEDALEQEMHALTVAGGDEIVIGNLYFPGCSIERHYNNMKGDKGEYSYRKIAADGRVDTIAACTISRALADEEWDYITFQQASHFSGQYETFERLPELIAMVRKAVGARPVFLWHMTWAYSPDSRHDGFKNYGKSQIKMYRAIVDAARKALADNPELKGVIPSGTAIQDARTSALGDDLTRDGYHLSYTLGRYIAACTWYGTLFGHDVVGNPYSPARVNAPQRRLAQEAAEAAIKNPFSITQISCR